MRGRFSKYQGLGNDFVMLDGSLWAEREVHPDLARALCDRHRGVGADGVIRVEALGEREARMVIYNADGSRPEMCGNGVRCVAAWWADRGLLREGGTLTVQSDAGPRPATLRADRGGERWVEVAMGRAVVSATETVRVGERDCAVEVVDVGNPHGVLFEPEGEAEALAAAVRTLGAFPAGVNVELVTPMAGGGWRARVSERGVGWTQACGTGACAVAAAAVARGRARAGEAVTVRLDGGDLTIVVEEGGAVTMTGPARRVFDGEL